MLKFLTILGSWNTKPKDSLRSFAASSSERLLISLYIKKFQNLIFFNLRAGFYEHFHSFPVYLFGMYL